MSEIWNQAAELFRSGESFVVVTLISTRGHAPQDPSAKAIVTRSGLHWGTVGGGKVEAKCQGVAEELLASGQPAEPLLLTWNLQRDVGMCCGGEVTYLFEKHETGAWKIAVFGAGHVSQALVRLLATLQCQVTCFDPREEWISKLPTAQNIHPVLDLEPEQRVKDLDPQSYIVVMTKGHGTDMPILRQVYQHHPDAPYIGVIGSKVKAIKMRAALKEEGIASGRVERLHSPMGFDIGSSDPAEIAVSIAAQLMQVRDDQIRDEQTSDG